MRLVRPQDRVNITDKTQFNSYPYADSKKLLDDSSSPMFKAQIEAYEKEKRDNDVLNVLGISCTSMPPGKGRQSTSERALERALQHARTSAEEAKYKANVKCDTVMIKLRDLDFNPASPGTTIRSCEGYYSTDKTTCNWPCVITGDMMDNPNDKMDVIYWALAYWADIVFVATPIRYGNASALYYKIVERLNSIHNEITLRNHHVINDKVAGFIITGGQDGIQAVAGQMLTFWSELGYNFSRYSYVGWSRGWYAESTEKNFPTMTRNPDFANDLNKFVEYAIDLKLRLDIAPSLMIHDYEDKNRRVSPLVKLGDPALSQEEKAKPELL